MLKQKAIVAIFISLLFSGVLGSESRGTQNVGAPDYLPVMRSVENQKPPSADLKVLAEGFHSSITKPFVAVVRDAETYAALVKLDGNLPKLDEEFFKTKVVVAAFLGERNTGGYSVEITRIENGQIQIDEKGPAKGVMVPQVITSPFKLISVSTRGNRPLLLLLNGVWRQGLRPYRIKSGDFTMSGGFAGTVSRFGLEGQLRVMRQFNLATFVFDILSSGLTEHRSLRGFETGVVERTGEIAIHTLNSDSLVNSPNPGLKATGTFSDTDKKLSLNFNSLPSMIADGYAGQGSLEAETIGSTAKQQKP